MVKIQTKSRRNPRIGGHCGLMQIMILKLRHYMKLKRKENHYWKYHFKILKVIPA